MVKGRHGGPGRAGEHAQSRAKGMHSHAGKSRGLTKAKRKRPEAPAGKHNAAFEPPVAAAVASSSAGSADADARVLLVGEGDFAYAAALALSWGQCANLTATTIASETSTLRLDEAEDNIECLRAFGGTVAFKIDATNLQASDAVMARRGKKGYDRIVFNFPSAVSVSGGTASGAGGGKVALGASGASVEAQQALLRGLFKSVLSSRLLRVPSGELHVALRKVSASGGFPWLLTAGF